MRKISNDISERLSRNIQTRENNANPSATVWVTRPQTAIKSEEFLERQDILNENIYDVSIAACHPVKNLSDSEIYIAYISNGIAKILKAATKTNILGHLWEPINFETNATAVSLAFNGKMVNSLGDKTEIVTEDDPWVFWVAQDKLYARKINEGGVVNLSSEGSCADVSAIRAVWSLNGAFDFGLVVFFILNHKIFYRQLINGEWMDALKVEFGPENANWSKVEAFRTWDYRIGIQAQTTDGKVYELFTQFMGIGRRNTEHIEVLDIKADSRLKEVKTYEIESGTEHVNIVGISSSTPYGGLYSATTPEILSVSNMREDNGEWGRYVKVVFNNHIKMESISGNITQFTLSDSEGKSYIASNATLDSDGKTLILDFISIYSAVGECTLSYTKGNVVSMADVEVPDSEFTFTPVHLDGTDEYLPPEPVSIWNTNSDGTEIAIRFTFPITSELEGNEDKFTTTIQEYNYYPGGTLTSVSKSVTSLKNTYCSAEDSIDLSNGEFTDTIFTNTGIRLEVDE